MRARPQSVLVADDDPTARLLMKAALEKHGYRVVLAEDGAQALRLFQAEPCDLVMLDVDMPQVDGFQVCASLRLDAHAEQPIVMVTGMDDLESIDRAFATGATDFIAKPLNWALIAHRVRYLLRAYQVLLDLHQANARNAAMLDALPDTLIRLDAGGTVREARAANDRNGGAPAFTPGRPLDEALPKAVAARLMAAAAAAHAAGVSAIEEFEIPVGTRGTRQFEARLAWIDRDHVLCLLRDITERKRSERAVYRLAYFDVLTGLPNRLSFAERLEREVQRARNESGALAVLFLDLDGFKDINDTYGHATGDLMLQRVADRLQQGLRPSDLIARDEGQGADMPGHDVALARLGGDEFTVLLPHLQRSTDALGVTERIQALMNTPFDLNGRDVVLTASIGIAVFPDDGRDAPTLLKHADTAMYHAKSLGRNHSQFYCPSLTLRARQRLDLESSLRHALEREEFFLVYQPQLDLRSGRIRSVEALIRWQHPEQGLVAPNDFIPAAEENGLVIPMGDWVLRTACATAARWRAQGMALRVGVNLSARQLRVASLVDDVRTILTDTGLPADLLELEVTESALVDDTEALTTTLDALRAIGVRLSLDDFGTGYSSLSYLRRMPLDTLKVDQSFVRGLPDDADSLNIVQTIVALARNMGFTVTAEGIETREQAMLFKHLACDTAQGYYISRPVPASEIPALVARQWRLDETR